MVRGLNTDVRFADRVYHVQTEGRDGPDSVVETLVFDGGEILTRRKTSWAIPERSTAKPGSGLRRTVERQHWSLVDGIRQGTLDDLTAETVGRLAPARASREPDPSAVAAGVLATLRSRWKKMVGRRYVLVVRWSTDSEAT